MNENQHDNETNSTSGRPAENVPRSDWISEEFDPKVKYKHTNFQLCALFRYLRKDLSSQAE